jgi:hypothetical protein
VAMDPLVQDIIELFHARVLHVEKKPASDA